MSSLVRHAGLRWRLLCLNADWLFLAGNAGRRIKFLISFLFACFAHFIRLKPLYSSIWKKRIKKKKQLSAVTEDIQFRKKRKKLVSQRKNRYFCTLCLCLHRLVQSSPLMLPESAQVGEHFCFVLFSRRLHKEMTADGSWNLHCAPYKTLMQIQWDVGLL